MAAYVKKIGDYVAFIGLGGLIILSLVILFDIVGREILGMPIPGFSDITGELIIISAAACFPSSFLDRSHVSVRFVGQVIHWRGREILDLLGTVASLVILTILDFELFKYAGKVWANNETTWLIALPIWPVWWTVTVLMVISTVVQLYMTGVQIERVFSPIKLADQDSAVPENGVTLSNEE